MSDDVHVARDETSETNEDEEALWKKTFEYDSDGRFPIACKDKGSRYERAASCIASHDEILCHEARTKRMNGRRKMKRARARKENALQKRKSVRKKRGERVRHWQSRRITT